VTNIEVLEAELSVSGLKVLFGDENTLTEEVLVDLLAIGFRDEPGKSC